MDKEEYYKISKEKELPLRCPIINYCSRRAWTIYLFSEYSKFDHGLSLVESLLKDGTIPKDFEKKQIVFQGEAPSISRGKDHFYYSDMCPEVNLFDLSNALHPKKACIEGDYDKDRKTNQNRIIDTKHFSECAEFNKYLFDNDKIVKKNKSKSKRRKSIPYKTKALLQKEIHSECPICQNQDVEHFHVHHINENTEDNSFENLLMLCPNCHSKITKGDISESTVNQIKISLNKN